MKILRKRRTIYQALAIGINIFVIAGVIRLLGEILGIRMFTTLIFVFMSYYVAGFYNYWNPFFGLRIIPVSLILNLIWTGFVFFAKIYNLPSSLLIFGSSTIFQLGFFFLLERVILKSQRTVIISDGDPERLRDIRDVLNERRRHFSLVGLIRSGSLPEPDSASAPILGSTEEAEALIRDHKIRVVINATARELPLPVLEKLVFLNSLKRITYYNTVTFFEDVTERIPLQYVSEREIIAAWLRRQMEQDVFLKIKRVTDIVFALIVGVAALPFLLAAGLLTVLESPGPFLFKQVRRGLGKNKFLLYKLRSMRINKETKPAAARDPRITFWGNFTRKTRIDEFPQLYNILKNEMSFIGPRAYWDIHCEEAGKEIPLYDLRFLVKPGLSGWAQVNYGSNENREDVRRKLEYDLYYIKHQSLILDIKILLRTIRTVLFFKGL